jgi:sulfite reductase (NADPH) flavoprotein alpha-component
MSSGISTPLSQASTLTNSSELKENLEKGAGETLLAPSIITEYYASKASSAVFVYDLAQGAGFGQTCRDLLNTGDGTSDAVVFDVQTRAGAGLQLLGRLTEGTSIQGSRPSGAITAFITPPGLAQMSPVLSLFEKPTTHSRLILQIPTITHLGSEMTVSPTLAHIVPFFSNIPEHFTVLLSATPQEIIDFTTISYSIPKAHVVHIFDHWSAGHEISRKRTPVPPPVFPVLDTHTAVRKAGYDFFEYNGDASAATVLVVLNGPLALSIKSVVSVIPSFGVLVVKVLRPWDEKALRSAIPKTVENVHVLDDVFPGSYTSPLYQDVLGSLVDGTTKSPRVFSQRLEPTTLNQLLVSAQSIIGYLSSILPINWFAAPTIPPRPSKRITFYSTPTSPLRTVPDVSSQLFLQNAGINARLNSVVDAFSKAGGVTQSTLLLSPVQDAAPIPFKVGQGPEADSLVVLEPSLLTTHDLTSHLKDNAPVLITTAWNSEEVISNISAANLENIKSKNLRVLTIDAETVAKGLKEVDVAAAIAMFAFLRLYIGQAADQKLLAHLGVSVLGEDIQGVPTHLIAAAAWDSLRSVSISSNSLENTEEGISREFTFNALSSSSTLTNRPATVAQPGSWIDVAKHIVFREAYVVPKVPSSEQYPVNPALRPDVPERTFLVTCSVNRRLTPLEYDRNVFHLEFDTSGTGLKYEIGEALGVHGWNDTQDVLDFCAWYGVDPNKVLQIPVPGDPTKRHIRTVFQVFQQQIDLFGKPPKSFYEALSGYATSREDRMALRFISSAEGSSTFKKLSELDTVTFADVLQKFPSARPSVETLCEFVGDIKPRHYSIASAQSAVGDRVDLLVVTVDWVTPSGKAHECIFLQI